MKHYEKAIAVGRRITTFEELLEAKDNRLSVFSPHGFRRRNKPASFYCNWTIRQVGKLINDGLYVYVPTSYYEWINKNRSFEWGSQTMAFINERDRLKKLYFGI